MTHAALAGQPRPVVSCRRVRPGLQQRLRTLAARTDAFTVAPGGEAGDGGPTDGAPADGPPLDDLVADVVVVEVRDEDPDPIDVLRGARRAASGARYVVAGSGIAWFDAAFAHGADAWVDERADDETLLAAIVGGQPRTSRRDRSAGPRRAVRPYLPRLRRRNVERRTGGASCGSW